MATAFSYADPTPDGVVMAFAFDADGGARQLSERDVPALGAHGAGFVWVHLNLVDHRSRAWLDGQPVLTETAVEAMTDPGGYQRLTVDAGLSAGVFADAALEFDRDGHDVAQLGFILGPGFLVTARRKPMQSVQHVKRALETGETAETPLALLELIVDAELAGIDTGIAELSAEVEAIENRLLSNPTSDERRSIVRLRRRASRLNKQLYAMLALFRSAGQRRRAVPPRDVVEVFADIVHRLEATHQELQAVKEAARLLGEEIASNLSIETNRQLYILSMLTAVFLPATLVTGFFGMNTRGLIGEVETGTATLLGGFASIAVYLWLTRAMRPR